MRSWMRWFKGQTSINQNQVGSPRSEPGRFAARRRRPALEALEDRLAPAFNLTISNGLTFGVTLLGGVVTATASGANVNVLDIRDALLAGNDVAISNGFNGDLGGEAGNITWLGGADLNYGGAFARSLVITAHPNSVNGAITLNANVNASSTTLDQFYGAQDDLIIDNAIHAGGGTVVLVSLGGEVNGNGSIIAADLSATAFGDITLDQNNDVTTGVFAALVTGAGAGVIFNDVNNLTIGTVGTTNSVDGVTTNGGPIQITAAAGNLVVTEDVDADGGDISLSALGGESVFRNNALITTSGGNTIDIAANHMILDGAPGANAITAVGGGRVILHATGSGRPINLAPTDPNGALSLSDVELDSITTTGVVQIGDAIEGNVAVTSAISPNNFSTLTINTAAGISGAGAIAVPNLRLSSRTAVSLTGANDVDVLAGEVINNGQPFTFNNAGPLTIGTVDGVTGVTTNNGPIVITTSTGALTLDEAVAPGAAGIVLTAGPANSGNPADVLTINEDLSAIGGNNITLGGNDLVVNAATIAVTGAGNITMSFGGAGGTAVFNSSALVSTANGNIDLTAAATVTLVGAAQLRTAAAGSITVTTDDLAIGASSSISANDGIANGNNVVAIRNFSAGRGISLGSNANLGLTDAELDRIQAELLRLGRNDTAATGSISLTGQVDLTAGANTVATLHLVTGAGVVDATAGEQADLRVNSLAIQARTGIGAADDLDIAVTTVAAANTGGTASGDIQLTNTGALTIGTVAGLSGVQRTGGGLADIAVAATTSLTVNAPVTNTTGGDIELSADTAIVLNGTAVVQTTVSGDIVLTADDLTVAGTALISTNDVATIRNATAGRAINLGSNTALGLTDAELDRVHANVLIVGRNDATPAGTVTVSAPVNLSAGANVVPVLHVMTGGGVAQAGAGSLAVAGLAMQAGAGIGVVAPLVTAIATLAASGGAGSVLVSNLGTLTIGTVTGVTGVSASTGAIAITNVGQNRAGAFVVAANVQTPGDITLTAQESIPAGSGDNLTVNPGVTVNSSAGATALRAGDILSLPVGAVVQAGGAATLIGGFGENDTGGAVVFLGTANGASVTVQGGSGDDSLIINPTSTAAALAVQGLAGNDTFAVTPNAATTFNVDGDLPTPPASPGDVLDVELAGTTDPTLTSTSTPTGLEGSYTFSNRMPVNFQEIETLTSAADVAVAMTDAPDPVISGENITYTITVSNLGEVNAENVALLDTMPANTTFVSFTQTSGPMFMITTPTVGGTGNVTATIAMLDAGATATFTLVVETADALANHTIITNTATVTTDSAESSMANNSATATTRIGPVSFIAAGAAQGQRPRVAVYSRSGALVANFLAYAGNFRGGVRVAVGDVNGDGTADIITAAGPGPRQLVHVVDGTQLSLLGGGRVPASALLRSFFVTSAKFKGGLFVAAGDVSGDGPDDIVIGMGSGAPRVLVFDGDTGARLANFKAYANTAKSGVTVAAGDVNGDLHADIIVAPQRGAQRVLVADGTLLPGGGGRITNASLLGSFFPLAPGFTGGFSVAAGDVNGDLRADVIVAPTSGAAPFVKVVDAARLNQVSPNGRIRNTALLANELVFAQSFRGGVQVGSIEFDLDGLAEVLVGTGPNQRALRAVDVLRHAVELSRNLPFRGGSVGGA
jgi:uncharacterized repeat protein (TIGR01451 family)